MPARKESLRLGKTISFLGVLLPRSLLSGVEKGPEKGKTNKPSPDISKDKEDIVRWLFGLKGPPPSRTPARLSSRR